jgi:hypothetical protein
MASIFWMNVEINHRMVCFFHSKAPLLNYLINWYFNDVYNYLYIVETCFLDKLFLNDQAQRSVFDRENATQCFCQSKIDLTCSLNLNLTKPILVKLWPSCERDPRLIIFGSCHWWRGVVVGWPDWAIFYFGQICENYRSVPKLWYYGKMSRNWMSSAGMLTVPMSTFTMSNAPMLHILNVTCSQCQLLQCQTPLNVEHWMSNVKCRMSNVECWMSNVECRMSNVECQMSNVEWRMSNGECRMSNVECRMSNVEWRMSNGECRMSNVECRMSNVECRTTET